jgi:hypothetical protein
MSITSLIDSNKGSYGTVKIVHRDQYGNIKNEYNQKIDSYIQQVWDKWFEAVFDGDVNSFSYTAISGGSVSSSQFMNWKADGGINEVRGIMAGTNATAVSFSNVNLLGRIGFGTSSNQLSASVVTVDYNNETGIGSINRIFTNNNSTTSPTVGELGVAFGGVLTSTNNMLGIRDVLDTPIQLFWKDTLEVTYTLEFTGGNINWNMLFGKHFFARNQSNVITFYDTSGTLTNGTYVPTTYYPRFTAPIGKDNGGIVVGSNSNTETFNTTALYGKISNGKNTGELIYGDSLISYTNTVSNGFYEYELSRYFKNETNSNITISEVGLESNVTIGSSDTNVLFARRNITPITIPPDEIRQIKWTIRYDF